MNKKKDELILIKKEIQNPEISNELIIDVILKGEFEELELLSQNLKFKNLNPELIISMSKLKELIWIKQVKNQTLISILFLLMGLFVFKFYNFINLIIFIYTIYLFKFKSKIESEQEKKEEKERIEYILNIIKNTELNYLPIDKLTTLLESHNHKL